MKKILVAGMHTILGLCYCWGLDWNSAEFYVSTDIEMGIIVSKSELLYVEEGLEKTQVKSRVTRPTTLVDEDGFVTIKLPTVETTVIDLNGKLIEQASSVPGSLDAPTYGINQGIQIKASSFLVETLKTGKIEYRPEYLLNRLTREKEVGEYLFGSTVPWVPDSKKDNLPKLSVFSPDPIKAILVLNGFVDVKRKHLFKENSRVKVIEVVDSDSKKTIATYTLADSPQYQRIAFLKALKKFDIVIVDSFPGTK